MDNVCEIVKEALEAAGYIVLVSFEKDAAYIIDPNGGIDFSLRTGA